MEKISAQQVQDLLLKSASALRTVVAERDALATKCAAYERREDATKVAHQMHDKGIRADVEFGDLVNELEKAAEEGQLTRIADAVDLAGPDMSEKIGSIVSDERRPRNGLSAFEQFVAS